MNEFLSSNHVTMLSRCFPLIGLKPFYRKIIIITGIILSFIFGQNVDTLKTRTPAKAAFYAMLFPGGGQLYNRKKSKAITIMALEIIALWKYNEHRINYRDWTPKYSLPKHRYLEKRNKYAWWVGFIYIYALLDAVVDAHLQSFEEIMSEDFEQPPSEKSVKKRKNE